MMSGNPLDVSQVDVETYTLVILQSADKGRGGRPKKLNSYQIAARFPSPIRDAFINADRFGGKGCTVKVGSPPLTMKVKNACKALAKKGLVSIDYQDTRGLQIEVFNGAVVVPSFGVCGLYQYIGK